MSESLPDLDVSSLQPRDLPDAPAGESSAPEPSVDGSGARADDLLRLTGIDKRFGGVHALKGVDFAVRPGEVHAIVGENGAGKSTLVGVAAGTVVADVGTVSIRGSSTDRPSASWAKENGLAVVYQEPALIPDLTVAENMRLGAPRAVRPGPARQSSWAKEQLAGWRQIFDIDPATSVRDLSAGERFIVEISRSLAARPSVLILDEPTEHLMPAAVDALFDAIRGIVGRGCSVVYISHRVHEVKRIADRITVLRDGAVRGTHAAADLSESQIVDLIVGRRLEARFPAKPDDAHEQVLVQVSGLSGARFAEIDLEVNRGEILGLGGIDGNGQREFLRALGGLVASHGHVRVAGAALRNGSPSAAAKAGVVYISNDRRREGMLTSLSIADNLVIRALGRIGRFGFLGMRRLADVVERAVASFGIKIGSPRDPIETLSGGNQQKVMLARAMLTEPTLVLADEPSQGVDVGARAEIYRILREATAQGSAVILVSSDASELEGLCDRVVVFSRGQIVADLAGDDVSEREITTAAVTTTTTALATERRARRRRFHRLFEHDSSPSIILALAVVVLGIVAAAGNPYYLTPRNMFLVLPLVAIIIFFSLGQQLVMMTGGIDLSVGPLAGLISVVASFTLTTGVSGLSLWAGLALLVVLALAAGAVNWVLIDVFGIGPIIATLVTFTGIQGIALVLRPTPGGTFDPAIIDAVSTRIGFVPVTLIVAVALAVACELMLYLTVFGLRLRSTGSAPGTAGKLAVTQRQVRFLAYIGCSLLALLGSIALLPQLGSGNAGGGTLYSLASITAVVLGGASIFGGRGSFVGALLGGLLIVQINTVVQFLGLTAYWQDWVLGGLTIIAVAVYSSVRAGGVRTR